LEGKRSQPKLYKLQQIIKTLYISIKCLLRSLFLCQRSNDIFTTTTFQKKKLMARKKNKNTNFFFWKKGSVGEAFSNKDFLSFVFGQGDVY
jgi:hypothetical protein